jgi:HemK-related putative methylase
MEWVFKDNGLKIVVNERVYEPAEDSFLLAKYAGRVKGKLLDMGCGTGIVGLYALNNGADVVFADVSEEAIKLTKRNLALNNFSAPVIHSNLFENVNETFDVIAFNPPYLEGEGEVWWSGGYALINTFLEQAVQHLNAGGNILLIVSSLTRVSKVKHKVQQLGLNLEVVEDEQFFFERLQVWKLE